MPMLEPYVPQLYSVGNRTRYQPYGTPYVRTEIPGAGFERRMFFTSQPLQLGALPPAAAQAYGTLLDPKTLFVIGCRGRKPRFVRGLEAAITGARAEAKKRRTPCNIVVPGRTRASLVPVVRIGPNGEVIERSGRTFAGLGAAPAGGGSTVDPGQVATVIANLIVDPDRELQRRGAAISAALDRHVATPLVESMGRQAQPYFWKYVFPPLLILYAISSIGAIKAWQAERRLARRAGE